MQNIKDKRIKTSVIVAVYNVSKYINECLESLNKQKEKDAEFIVIDDGSTDGSGEICDSWADKDSRFRIIHQENKGTLLARKTGVMQGQGDWVVFLDGDDLLAENALTDIKKLVETSNTDIIQFTVDCFEYTDNAQYSSMLSFINGHTNKKITGNINILSQSYIKDTVSWNVCKIYKKDLLKKVFSVTKNKYCICAEDAYTYFLCCYFANSFSSHVTRPLYLYRLNSGVSTSNETLPLFNKQVDEFKIVYWLRDFLIQENASAVYFSCLDNLLLRLTAGAVWRMAALPSNNLDEGFALLCKHHDAINYLPPLVQCFYDKQDELAAAAYKALSLSQKAIKEDSNAKKTIGIFYHRYFNGGLEKVISLQIPIFLSLGYKVVLFTEQIQSEKEYSLPSEVIRVIVPERYDKQRANVFADTFHKYGVDILCHHATSSPLLLFDLLLCRSLGVKTVIICHETTASKMSTGYAYPFNRATVYSLANTVCVLSSSEEYFYQQCGVNARYLQNPIEAIDEKFNPSLPVEIKQPIVIWVGRLDNKQKNYREALQIFKLILGKHQEMIGYIIGSGEYEDDTFVKRFIRKHNLKGRLIHIPYTPNVSTYYRMATVQLVTSSFESFSMVIVEGKLNSLPLVTYAMPYLEVLKDGKGYISVPQHNVETAAEAVLFIINNCDYAQQLSREARESIQPFIDFDLAGAWKEIIEYPENRYGRSRSKEEIKQARCFWDYTMSMYNEGCRQSQRMSIESRCKKILKESPIVAPLVNKLLPPGSSRRTQVRDYAKYIWHRLKKIRGKLLT